MTHDGIGKYLSQVVEKAPGPTDDVVRILKETGTDVVVNYLPVGSEAATKWYAEQILEAGVAMVNCMPVFLAREPYWQKRFEDAGCPIIGDDIKSQVGATISHRVLTTLFQDRGVHLDRTMQLNVGGNSDFRNMLERERLESKKISKTNAVTSMLDYDIGADNVHVGPSDYVPWLTDRKWAYIRMEGSSFGDVPLNVELKLEVWDSPNSAGIVIDAVRLAKLALNNGIAGALEAPSSYLMKSPPVQIVDSEASENTERFIAKNALQSAKKAKAAGSRLSRCAPRSRLFGLGGGGAVGGAPPLCVGPSEPATSDRPERCLGRASSNSPPPDDRDRARDSFAPWCDVSRRAEPATPPRIQSRAASDLPRDAPRVVGAARHERARRRYRRWRFAAGATTVVVLTPSSRSAELLAGRRALQTGELEASSRSRARFPSRRARRSGSRSASARTSPRRFGAGTSTWSTGSTPPCPGFPTSRCSRHRRRRSPRSSIPSGSASRRARTSATGCSRGSIGSSRPATRSRSARPRGSRAHTPSSRPASTSSGSRRQRRPRTSS